MFSNEKFIEASRKFVCIRIESYESEAAQKMVRTLLHGAFANTAFCIFDPQGTKWLTQAGRSPNQVLGRGRVNGAEPMQRIVDQMHEIAARYEPKTDLAGRELQDFFSFRQALNVASGDQRLLLFATGDRDASEEALQTVFADAEIVGRFHMDLIGDEDGAWHESVGLNRDDTSSFGYIVIHPGQFGMSGKVLAQLAHSANSNEIKAALLQANKKFAEAEERKVYRDHVAEGRRQRVYFENEMPYGEDRDGDGEIDHGARRR